VDIAAGSLRLRRSDGSPTGRCSHLLLKMERGGRSGLASTDFARCPMQIERDWKSPLWRSVAQGFLGGIALVFVTMVCFSLGVDLATTAFAYLIVIVLLSLMGSFYVSAVLSIIAVAALNFFFAPPIFNFRVDRPQDAVVVIAFLLTSLIVTGLVRKARSQTEETLKAEDELQRMQAELAHVTRVMTLGELTSSIAHEVNQPLAAIVTNAESCL